MANQNQQNPNGQVALTAQDIQDLIDNAVAAALAGQTPQQPYVQPQVQPQYPYAPAPQPLIINPPQTQNGGVDANTLARVITTILQNGGNPNNVDWNNMNPAVRNAMIGYANWGNPCMTQDQYNQLMLNELRELRYSQEARHEKHHSTKHKVLKYGGIALGATVVVGGACYAAHEIAHRHDKDKELSALTHFGDSFLAAKYGKDII